MATREVGDQALAEMVRCLDVSEVIELDFCGVSPSPSFADQAVGGLVTKLGLDDFRLRVRFKNVSPDVSPLLRHVILRKAALARSSKTEA